MKINANNLNRLENALETLSDILDTQPSEIIYALTGVCLISEEEAGDILEIIQ